MKNIVSLYFFIFSLVVVAQNTTFDSNNVQHLFWKIKGANSSKTSYLFGTIHLMPKDKFSLPKTVAKRVEKSDLLVLEIADLDKNEELLSLLKLNEGRMTDILSVSQRDSLYRYTKGNFGMDSSIFESTLGQYKPFVFLQLPLTTMAFNSVSYDLKIQEIALENKVPTMGLETMEEQLALFDNMDTSLTIEMIMQTIRDTSGGKVVLNKLQDLYLTQQISKMGELETANVQLNQFFSENLLAERNKRWIPLLEKEMEDQSVFIAVGAGHLLGKNGLLQLFHNVGFSVTPVEIKLQ